MRSERKDTKSFRNLKHVKSVLPLQGIGRHLFSRSIPQLGHTYEEIIVCQPEATN